MSCERRFDAMLEATMLHQERPEVTLVPFGILWESLDVNMGTIGNLLELE
jgi:hypothetical protein